jgi:hypothetical protein
MRTFCKWALVLALPAVWVAAAQPATLSLPDGTTVKLILLRQKSVQEELKCSPDVVKKVMEFTDKEYEKAQKALKLKKKERRKKFAELGKANREFLKNNLKPEQDKRLTQIMMQFTGLMQLRRPPIIKLLKLTNAQQEKIKELQEKARKILAKLLSEKDREGLSAKFEKLRQKAREEVLALMTDDQKAKIRVLVGEPFKGKVVFEKLESGSKDK